MKDARGELTPGRRYYFCAACDGAVADDCGFDERAALDGRDCGDGSSSSIGTSSSSLTSIGSSLSSSISAAVVSTAEVSRYRQCQRRRQRRRRRHASWWLGVVVGVYGLTARAATLHRHLRRCVVSLRALGRCETARVLLDRMRDARGELTPGVRHYVIAAYAVAVVHDRVFDETTMLDGRGWADGISSSGSPNGSSLCSSGSSLSSSCLLYTSPSPRD